MISGGRFEEGYGIDITEWFMQMLEKKPVRNSDIFHHWSFTACLQPAAANFVLELDQISLRNNFFFIQEFTFWHK